MKILYLMNTNVKGGATIALVNIIKNVMLSGHEVFVLTAEKKGYLTDELEKIGVKYFLCPMALNIYPKSRNPIRWLYKLFCLMKIWKKSRTAVNDLVTKLCPDIVHTNVGPFDVANDICKKMGIPHVWHCREYQDLDFRMHYFPSQKKFRKIIREQNNYCIAITKGIFDYWNLQEGKDVVLYDGVFENCQNIIDVCHKQKYFLFVGRIEPAKGALMLLEVFAQFVALHPDYDLLLAGSFNEDSPYYKTCKRFVLKRTLLDEHVKFLGIRDDVYSLMANATALVVPSDFEGFGFISVEAMLNSCLVIGKNSAGIKEQLDNGLLFTKAEIGLRFTNHQELLSCMNRAVSEHFDEMKKNALNTVLSLYSVEKCCARIMNFYSNVLRTK